jgi:hypothetical protein
MQRCQLMALRVYMCHLRELCRTGLPVCAPVTWLVYWPGYHLMIVAIRLCALLAFLQCWTHTTIWYVQLQMRLPSLVRLLMHRTRIYLLQLQNTWLVLLVLMVLWILILTLLRMLSGLRGLGSSLRTSHQAVPRPPADAAVVLAGADGSRRRPRRFSWSSRQ